LNSVCILVGPTVGGLFYELGGFTLPFVVNGIALLATAVLASIVMPMIHTQMSADGKATEGYGLFKILKIPGVFVAALSVLICAISAGFLSATLEPHLRPVCHLYLIDKEFAFL